MHIIGPILVWVAVACAVLIVARCWWWQTPLSSLFEEHE
jgi:ABC-type bacteriocin/lantibiotic exporter with double-glycine peptidase domain